MPERSVMRKIQELEDDKELAVVRKEGAHNWYIIRLGMNDERVKAIFAARGLEWTPDNLSPPTPDNLSPPTPDNLSPVTHVSPPRDKGVTPTSDKAMSPESSFEPSSNHHHAAGAASDASNLPDQEPTIYEHHMVDNTDKMWTCPDCGHDTNVLLLPRSRATCSCGNGIKVYNEHGKQIRRPPQVLRRKSRGNGKTPWLLAVRAFCDLAGIKYASLRHRTLGEWAHKLRDLAGEHTLEEMCAAIPQLDVWDGDGKGLLNPYMDRFDRALTAHFLQLTPESKNIVIPEGNPNAVDSHLDMSTWNG
jgi:hypothetical protein